MVDSKAFEKRRLPKLPPQGSPEYAELERLVLSHWRETREYWIHLVAELGQIVRAELERSGGFRKAQLSKLQYRFAIAIRECNATLDRPAITLETVHRAQKAKELQERTRQIAGGKATRQSERRSRRRPRHARSSPVEAAREEP